MSPYFFDLSAFADGAGLSLLGDCYAELIADAGDNSGLHFDLLFGAAYKGIPLLAATALSLHARGVNLPWAFNRKETKLHGEGGRMVGAPLSGRRVLLLDDVLTAGTAVREAATALRELGAHPAGLAVALDRCERGASGRATAQELREEFQMPVLALAGLEDLASLLDDPQQIQALQQYRERYAAE